MIGEPPRYQLDVAGGYQISTDPSRMEPLAVWAFLHRQSDWARGIPYDMVARTLAASLNFGLFSPDEEPVGFARVVTDFGKFAYLWDVYVLPEHLGRRLGRALVRAALAHPVLAFPRRIVMDNPAHHLERRQSAETLWPRGPAV